MSGLAGQVVGGDVEHFGIVVLLVGAGVLVALVAGRLAGLIRVPTPALFLVGAALASDVFPTLGELPGRVDERIVTVALVVILLHGGMGIGWQRLRPAIGAVLWIGVAGTLVTAAGVAVLAHLVFSFGWTTALLLGTALAPTDPAVVFSVLGGREVEGRTGTILEGESGANDPVGIALLVAVAGATGGGLAAVGAGAGQFALQMVLGLAIGVGGGAGLRWVVVHVPTPDPALDPLRALAGAAVIYGAATALGGSGFLAVFIAGILLGDAGGSSKHEVERFTSALASTGEVVAFVILGFTVSVRTLVASPDLWVGLALAGMLVLLVRPVLVGALLTPIRLRAGERLFLLWAGLKGAVPVLLGLLLVEAHVADSERVYRIVFVVVLVSVVVQGGTVPLAAKLLRVPMRDSPSTSGSTS